MCKKANSDLREYSEAKGVPQYKIAKACSLFWSETAGR